MGVELDKWIEKVKRCEHLAEDELKSLCEYVSNMISCAIRVAVQLWSAAVCKRWPCTVLLLLLHAPLACGQRVTTARR